MSANSILPKFHNIDLSGYTAGVPTKAGLIDSISIDGQVASETRCPDCETLMHYEPFVKRQNRHIVSYRAFAVCPKCHAALEF